MATRSAPPSHFMLATGLVVHGNTPWTRGSMFCPPLVAHGGSTLYMTYIDCDIYKLTHLQSLFDHVKRINNSFTTYS